MEILIVTNPENSDPIHCYSAKCTDDRVYDVEMAFEELGIEVPATEVEDIAQELMHHRNYWFNETYCFETIVID